MPAPLNLPLPHRPAPLDPARLDQLRAKGSTATEPVSLLGLETAYYAEQDEATVQVFLGATTPGVLIGEVYTIIYVSPTQVPLELAYTGLQLTGATFDLSIYTGFLLTGRFAAYSGQTLNVAVYGTYSQDGNAGSFGPFETTLDIT